MTSPSVIDAEYRVVLRDTRKHEAQHAFVTSNKKRIYVRAGRRGGKTVGVSTRAVRRFLAGRRVLYAAPTIDQVSTFWYEVKKALQEPIDAGLLYKNEAEHIIEIPRTRTRIKAKTAFNADTLRGDFADDLILDEWQLMDEETWEVVGAPMLLDNDGDAVFIYTPPSLRSRSVSKARDPRHAGRMFKEAQEDTTGRWATFHFSSHANPFISKTALEEITHDMTALAIRQEIMAEDVAEVPGALWSRDLIERSRIRTMDGLGYEGESVALDRIVIGVDPPGGVTECGIVAAGVGKCACAGRRDSEGNLLLELHGFIINDSSLMGSPGEWSSKTVSLYDTLLADRVVGEKNYGGDMVENTVRYAAADAGKTVSYRAVQATRGKAVRAEPVVAFYEQGRMHHVGEFPALEDEMCGWVPGETKYSPNRLDAMVWAVTELMVTGRAPGDFGFS